MLCLHFSLEDCCLGHLPVIESVKPPIEEVSCLGVLLPTGNSILNFFELLLIFIEGNHLGEGEIAIILPENLFELDGKTPSLDVGCSPPSCEHVLAEVVVMVVFDDLVQLLLAHVVRADAPPLTQNRFGQVGVALDDDVAVDDLTEALEVSFALPELVAGLRVLFLLLLAKRRQRVLDLDTGVKLGDPLLQSLLLRGKSRFTQPQLQPLGQVRFFATAH